MNNKFSAVKILKSSPIYNKFGVVIVKDTLRFADGSTREYVYFKSDGTVAVAAFTNNGKMILTKQYRHPLRRIVYDIPGGAVEEGETPSQAALRELEEETGFTAEKLEWIGRFSRGPSSQAIVDIFLAKETRRKGNYDPNEIADIELADFNLLFRKILEGECFDAALAIAILLISAREKLD